tara:strand:+ start:69 stop:638 length:570 start_codon:yes stop_codon:yes gene_type:complete
MALFPARPGDLPNYGYQPERQTNLNKLDFRWQRIANQNWLRPFEVPVTKAPTPCACSFTPESLQEFHVVCRESFRHIGQRHNIPPRQLWLRIEAGLQVMGMHSDDIDACEQFLAGWIDFSLEEMERFRWRYPERCPLLDVLCSLDDTYERLNRYQDWILEMKGSKGRRRNDVLPPLPDPDGLRPAGIPS